ncbi:glycine-rich RNA-binding protein 1 [Phtheirospermum japonicum]|uniref:Glycine-rich RNA-binding protein 1 n=1 Tax=Phtheirospermum japonicum TaxID=374723 RepID=A0A830D4T1_9LAMI|nr:glycine-rich RNA-binding protein 1 [Phtheirospermum japonicum]
MTEVFSTFDDVNKAKVIIDEGKSSRGFGFVEFLTNESARSALNAIDGQMLNGKNLCVSYAQVL